MTTRSAARTGPASNVSAAAVARPRPSPDRLTFLLIDYKGGATFVSLEDCPNHWVPGTDSDPWTCAHVNLDGPGLGFEGDYWLAPRYGTALFQRIQDPDKWNLLEAIWEK